QAKRFGASFAEYCGAEHGVMMPHGTDSIMAALTGVLDLDGFEDAGEVIMPNYTFIATASAALDRRFTIAFVDIDPDTFTLLPEAVEAAITERTRAILPVHIGGHPADMDALRAIATKHGLKLVEDCAQAHGAQVNGARVGSLGDAAAFSFQSSKNLTSGEGGAVTTNDKDVRDRVIAFMDVGRHPDGGRWEYPRMGWNYRPSEYLAALLNVRLRLLEDETLRRNENGDYVRKFLNDMSGITPPRIAPYCSMHGYHLYMMKYDADGFGGHSRGEFLAALNKEGVPCTSGYGQVLSEHEGLKRLASKYPHLMRTLPCPNVEKVCAESVWFYQNQLLGTRDDMNDIVESIAKIQKAFRADAMSVI
ncbi:MAG: DegT/DnrJ/EryC1/StrS family aminotransferase, partial [Candidatus Poribacteria bacterium]|nr:DegT/DnrJ/EryC1/StrS family aminotransferase [Candidatus Poribacteria bacterium]